MKKQFTLIAWITLIMTLLLSSCQRFEGDAIQKLAYGKDESGRHFVDLGLSVKWATCNIGAETPEQQGLLYAWGETTPKEEYTWDNYKFGPDTALSKYCAKPDVAWHGFTDAKTTLELSDDAAHVNWRGRWRMPTQAEWKELIEKCTWTQTEYMGVKGYDVKASNGNRIFLPAPDENALYASSSLIETRPGEALHLPIFDQYDALTAQYRYRAYSVRAVYGSVLPQYCLVNFDANGGEGIMHPQQFSKGALIPLTEVRFTKQASVFSSWNTKADGSGTSYKDKASIITDKSFTIYAQWTPCYTITFDANGGEGTMDSLTIVSGTKKPLPANTFTRSGYVFAAWNTAPDGSGTAYKESSEISPTQNMTLYAQWTPCYTITFDANGGEGTMDSLQIVQGEETELPANTFTRDGYVFAAWNTAPDGSGISYKEFSEIEPTQNMTLYAQWTPCYTITFDANGGEGTMDSLTIVSGEEIELPANTFTRNDYVFAGWNTAPDGSGTAYKESSKISPTENMTLYAQWTPCYTITFNANGGEGTMDSLTIVSGEEIELPANTFTRDGYVFAGWNTVPDGSGTSYVNNQVIILSQDITLYAQWKLDRGVENGHEWVDLGLPSGLKWATCNVGATTPEGYGDYFAWGETSPKSNYTWEMYKFRTSGDSYNNVKFNKYNTSSDYGTIDNKTTLDLSDDAARANWGGTWRTPTKTEQDELRINCTWTWTTKNGIKGYKIASKTNGNSIFLPAAGRRRGTSVYDVGSSGYYWSSSLDESDPSRAYYLSFNSGGVDWYSYTRYYGHTVRAVFSEKDAPSRKFIVVFNANGGSGTMSAQQIMAGVSHPLSPNTFTRSGYTFVGWNTAPDGSGTSYTDKQVVTLTEDLTLYAQWEQRFYVSFEANGGTGEMEVQTFVQGETKALLACDFSNSGYMFTGWNTEADGSGTSYSDKQIISVTQDLTLYAQWKRGIYTVTFDANGGTGFMSAQTFEGGVSQALASNSFTRAGYSFINWNTSPDGSGTSYTNMQKIVLSQDITLYAQWKKATYTLTFDANGGEGSMPAQEFEYGVSQSINTNLFTRYGYVFNGWNTAADGSGTSYTDMQEISLTRNTTLFAQWKPYHEYYVTFDANGGEGEMEPQLFLYGIRKPLMENSFTREGYVFMEWNREPDGSGTTYQDQELTSLYENITLYAQWHELYKITFDSNGGTGSMEPQTFEEGVLQALNANKFTCDGYAFARWNTAADGSGTSYTNQQEIMLTQNITLYAQWKSTTGTENGYEWVDLGLPSGLKWATCNVGATTPEGYGDYFAWGETSPKDYYDWSTYKYCNGSAKTLTKYNISSDYGMVDNITTLEISDDAAHANMGGVWRMPTKSEQDELRNNCTWTWTTQNGVNGYKIASKTNGNSIFLPAAGSRNGISVVYGSYGNYWSSSLEESDPSYYAYFLEFYSGTVSLIGYYRYNGRPVRAVCP